MRKDLRYRPAKELIEKMHQQNLIIEDELFAINALEQFGYSNLIKSYRDPYVYTDHEGKKKYRDGVTFEQICSLYMLDKQLRNAVMSAMLDYEEHIKVFAAHTIAAKYGSHQDDYLKFSNYRDRRKKKPQFQLQNIINKMKGTLLSEKDPIHHYYTKHGQVPPWILFNSVYFSTIINFVDKFKTAERDTMVSFLYPPNPPFPAEDLRRFMMDTMFIANEYRNLAAHGGRIYNHKCDYTPRATGEISTRLSATDGLSRLLFALSFLKNQTPFNVLNEALNRELNRHCSKYPQDVTYLGEILQINIQSVTYVYASEKSKKYHNDPRCSGMRFAKQMELAEAQKKGFIPCKRCIKTVNE